jgi:hypothetical protein
LNFVFALMLASQTRAYAPAGKALVPGAARAEGEWACGVKEAGPGQILREDVECDAAIFFTGAGGKTPQHWCPRLTGKDGERQIVSGAKGRVDPRKGRVNHVRT